MTEEDAPAGVPASSNNLLYAGIGILLFLLTACIAGFFLIDFGGEEAGEPVAAPTAEDVDAGPTRESLQSQTRLELPEVEPDAGPPDAGPEEVEEAPEEQASTTRRGRGGGGGGGGECNGDIDRAGARREISNYQGRFQRCYERRLRDDNFLQGNLVVTFVVGRDGRVLGNVPMSGSMRDAAVRRCVREEARNMRFPPVTGGRCVRLEAPLRFTPRN